MTLYESSQEWLEQSRLLFEARPKTTKVTTRYTLNTTTSKRKRKHKATKPDSHDDSHDDTAGPPPPPARAAPPPQPPRGTLVLKTWDPVSGVVLKYETQKAAEVTRLIHALGQLGRDMAGIPDTAQDPSEPAAATTTGPGTGPPAGADPTGRAAASEIKGPREAAAPAQEPPAAPAGGKKRKKGKR